ncbi:AraC family transcriptional regulator [Muricoccus radiodurans]|uniref:AraC family transcriptional regulator n=1 Tax=Muricoccus radiodurans TaxID=2231721 RepID=UPI003CFA6C61
MPLKPATRLDYGARIARAMALLARDPDRLPDLAALAEAAAFSPCHFHRIYRLLTGETPAETLIRLRLHRGAAALIRGREPVETAAREAGYSGAASFTRAFRAAYGVPPAAYRALGGLGRVLRPHPHEERITMPDVSIRDLPPLRLAVMPHHGAYTEIGSTFDRLLAWAAAHGLSGNRFIGRYFDDPETVPAAQLRSEAGMEVGPEVQGDGEVRIVELPALRVAALRFQGPYAELEGAYDALFRDWLPASGEEPADLPCMEDYLNDCRSLPPSEWLTDILVPLKS